MPTVTTREQRIADNSLFKIKTKNIENLYCWERGEDKKEV